MSNVVLTAYSVKNGQKGTIANDISGEAQSVAYLLKFVVFRCLIQSTMVMFMDMIKAGSKWKWNTSHLM